MYEQLDQIAPEMTTTGDTNGHVSGDQGVDDCPVCRQLRPEGPRPYEYVVAPADGGGWPAWSAALVRLFQRIGSQPTQAVIIEQPVLCERYVQVMIGHGIAHAEASSNVYLSGDSRLTDEQESLLAEAGWLPPTADFDDPDEMPANWYLPLVHDEWQQLVQVLLATVVGILGFSERLPVEVRSFAVDNPCRDCSWPAES